ncbi:uncharacterized protein LOC119465227 isoform X1 [Dermacentor silvarum]|uniref:uncharacterized protein LOC119465227 isoform X1 n=1 Tax=Dermacentor silvarum TaxID=543639 RepID=UPI0018991654|nr:uncharacterized protein LOC119465227 isoform X1 [Dermacentor silvarum]
MVDAARTPLYLFLVFYMMNVVTVHTEEDKSEDTSIDSHVNCTDYQDIVKAFNMSNILWILGFNFHSNHSATRSCIFLNVSNLSPAEMNYSSNFIKNGSRGSFQYHGTFYSTPYTIGDGEKRRETPNSVTVRTNQSVPDALPEMNYTLIYSDYEVCMLLRLTSLGRGYGCMVLLTTANVTNGMPPHCEKVYNNSCGRYHQFHQIFNNTCDLNVTGASSRAPEE